MDNLAGFGGFQTIFNVTRLIDVLGSSNSACCHTWSALPLPKHARTAGGVAIGGRCRALKNVLRVRSKVCHVTLVGTIGFDTSMLKDLDDLGYSVRLCQERKTKFSDKTCRVCSVKNCHSVSSVPSKILNICILCRVLRHCRPYQGSWRLWWHGGLPKDA